MSIAHNPITEEHTVSFGPFEAKLLFDVVQEALDTQPDSFTNDLQTMSAKIWRENAERIHDELQMFLQETAS